MASARQLSTDRPEVELEPVLRSLLKAAAREHRELRQMFKLLGWEHLPGRLKMEIRDDVSAMAAELRGHYCSCDRHVERRRRRVLHWVTSYEDGLCSLPAAIAALRVTKL